ncbi:type IV secretory system conjugative DNA transfer family protein [Acetobacter pasteurianus]|uniref:type IV secretory system conjugative DNA transfer family protein n=1 Tax=Acetobacter pasteurianus TaxID=438 RepID=UPI0013641112|nr:type IV secretory system conjugative DNA transfer family protein [Acetobacter pasteurianus]QHM90038.1 type IV secretory system conjugative DNA transfer family protein [Acetobacter pasteurianus]
MHHRRLIPAYAVAAVSLFFCAPAFADSGDAPEDIYSVDGSGRPLPINPTYRPGQLNQRPVALPSLHDLEGLKGGSTDKMSQKEQLHMGAMRDAAISYGSRVGHAWGSQQVNAMLDSKAGDLSVIFDFNRLIVVQPGGVAILPPVISESQDTFEQSDAGASVRVADRYYRILSPARLGKTAPTWASYLRQHVPQKAPALPSEELLPKNDSERSLWKAYVHQGWDEGQHLAFMNYKRSLARLERDYKGMVRYKLLLEENKVSAPNVATGDLGVTGTGMDMRENDRTYRITAPSLLNVRHPENERAVPSQDPPEAAAIPPGHVSMENLPDQNKDPWPEATP